MSLTTAVSEDDDGESVHNSPYKAKQSGSGASFNCTGAVRKAGFLSVKKWLLRKKHQVELARKRGWKGYWVCLKGTTLLFYPCDSREVSNVTFNFSLTSPHSSLLSLSVTLKEASQYFLLKKE